METSKRFNKSCKYFYKSLLKEDPGNKTITLILHTFQLMKAIDKKKPIMFFNEKVLIFKDAIMKRDLKMVDLFIEKNPSYIWIKEGFDVYMNSEKSMNENGERIKNFIWDQIYILIEIGEAFIAENRKS